MRASGNRPAMHIWLSMGGQETRLLNITSLIAGALFGRLGERHWAPLTVMVVHINYIGPSESTRLQLTAPGLFFSTGAYGRLRDRPGATKPSPLPTTLTHGGMWA